MQDKNISKVFEDAGVVFEGTGRGDYNTATRNSSVLDKELINEENEDPFNILGYGWTAYFSTLRAFAVLFTVLTLIMIPVFKFYYDEGGLKLVSRGYYNSAFMLGNVGFSKAVCVNTYTQFASSAPAQLQCEVGTMTGVIYSGMIPNNLDIDWENISYGYCGDPFTTYVGTNPDQAPPNTDICTKTFLDQDKLTADFDLLCAGQTSCSFTVNDYVIDNSTATASEQDLCVNIQWSNPE